MNVIANPHMLVKVRSDDLRSGMETMPCCARVSSMIPGFTCAGPATVIPAHLPVFGKGVATKVSDLFMIAACLHCHDLIDGRDKRVWWIIENYPVAYYDRLLKGYCETLARWVQMGLLVVPDGRLI